VIRYTFVIVVNFYAEVTHGLGKHMEVVSPKDFSDMLRVMINFLVLKPAG
jgi:hypothetical protein